MGFLDKIDNVSGSNVTKTKTEPSKTKLVSPVGHVTNSFDHTDHNKFGVGVHTPFLVKVGRRGQQRHHRLDQ